MHKKRLKYYESLSDKELVELLLANNQETIEYLFFHRCAGLFAHVIHSVFQSQGKQEELVSEFYLYLNENNWEKLRKFEFKSGLNTWLTVVAVRYFKNTHQNQTRNVPTEPQLINEVLKDKNDGYDVIDEMSRMELYKTIDKLDKPRERYALLAELSGKNAEDIAADMQCTVAAVYNLTKKARNKVKEMLGEFRNK